MEISFLLVLSGVWEGIYNTELLRGQANESLGGFLSSAYEYGHSDLSDNLDYGIMLKILFYQNECGESIDDRLVREKKGLERALLSRKSM